MTGPRKRPRRMRQHRATKLRVPRLASREQPPRDGRSLATLSPDTRTECDHIVADGLPTKDRIWPHSRRPRGRPLANGGPGSDDIRLLNSRLLCRALANRRPEMDGMWPRRRRLLGRPLADCRPESDNTRALYRQRCGRAFEGGRAKVAVTWPRNCRQRGRALAEGRAGSGEIWRRNCRPPGRPLADGRPEINTIWPRNRHRRPTRTGQDLASVSPETRAGPR